MTRKKAYGIGDTVRVLAIDPPVYQLPKGLSDGATVKVVKREPGYDTVEYKGGLYEVSMVLIDSGWERIPDHGS